MQELPELTAQPAGRDVLIPHRGTVGSALPHYCKTTLSDDKVMILVYASKILRRHIFDNPLEAFSGSLVEDCLLQSVPLPLFAFIKMTLLGPSIKSHN